jgi:hypothetical protein
MSEDDNHIIDMTLDGGFVDPHGHGKPPLGTRLMLWAILATVLAVSAAIVAVTLWFLAMILPLLLGVAIVAWLAHRYRFWRAGQGMPWRGPGGWYR